MGKTYGFGIVGCGAISKWHVAAIDQIENAKLFTKYGYCEMLEEEDYSKQHFLSLIKKLYNNREKYVSNIRKDKSPLANQKIVEIIRKNS